MKKQLNRLCPVALVTLVALVSCGPRGAPATPDTDRAFYEKSDAGVVLPSLVEEVHPEYTAEAKEAGIIGSVMLSAFVDRQGSVVSVEVTQSLDAELGLDDEAVAALRQWRFSPGTKDGEPVPVRVDVEMTFTQR